MSGFNDIFVVIASALLLTAVVWIGSAFAPGLGWWLAAASCWALSEFFVRRRRMALPTIAKPAIIMPQVAGSGTAPGGASGSSTSTSPPVVSKLVEM